MGENVASQQDSADKIHIKSTNMLTVVTPEYTHKFSNATGSWSYIYGPYRIMTTKINTNIEGNKI